MDASTYASARGAVLAAPMFTGDLVSRYDDEEEEGGVLLLLAVADTSDGSDLLSAILTCGVMSGCSMTVFTCEVDAATALLYEAVCEEATEAPTDSESGV